MIKEIIAYPNKLLYQDSVDVLDFNEELHNILDDMYETMIHSGGVGLAAIQIANPLNVLVINLPNEEQEQDKNDLIEAINPKIIESSGEQYNEEGCLSVPDFQATVKRFSDITVEYYDRHGKKHTKQENGYMAVAWQHEIDHLHGGLFIKKLSIIDRKKFNKFLRESN